MRARIENVVNLTPHSITLKAMGGSALIPPSGTIARCEVSETEVGDIHAMIPVVSLHYGAVTGLPDPMPGTVFIVSRLVAAVISGSGSTRNDLVYPTRLIRNAEGRVIGCGALAVYPPSVPIPLLAREHAVVLES